MKEIIESILEVEKRAKQVVLDVSENNETLDADLEKRVSELEKEIAQLSDKKIAEEISAKTEEAERLYKDMTARYEEQKKNLSERFEKEKGSWVNTIFEEIVG